MRKPRFRLSTLCLGIAIVAVPLAGIGAIYRMKSAAMHAQSLAARPLQRAARPLQRASDRGSDPKSGDGARSRALPTPSGWQTFVAADAFVPGGVFTFRAPPDLEPVPARGIDSFVGRYSSPSLEVDCDYGWYSHPLAPEDGFVAGRWITVDGRRARIARNPDLIGIHVPRVDGGNGLTMIVRVNDGDPAVAEMILRSITFPEARRDGP